MTPKTPSKNETRPLVLSLITVIIFTVSIIAAGYYHGHMNISAVLKNLWENFLHSIGLHTTRSTSVITLYKNYSEWLR